MKLHFRKVIGWTTIPLITLVTACSSHQLTQKTSQSTSEPPYSSTTSSQTALNPSQSLPKSTHHLKQVVSVKDKNLNMEFTVNGTREHKGKGVIKPNKGDKWIVVDVTLANKGKQPETFSVVSFGIIDSEDKQYDVALLAGALDDIKSPTGQINPGDKRRGEIAFEVPESAKELKLLFKPNRSECELPNSKSKALEALNCEPAAVKLN